MTHSRDWTAEDQRILDEYLAKFYHVGFDIKYLTKEIIMSPLKDEILNCLEAEIYHPQYSMSIRSVGRDH